MRSGYLTKSPPDFKVAAQWHRRWFVLADSKLVYPLADRYVRLEYYQSEAEARKCADPKGCWRHRIRAASGHTCIGRSRSTFCLGVCHGSTSLVSGQSIYIVLCI